MAWYENRQYYKRVKRRILGDYASSLHVCLARGDKLRIIDASFEKRAISLFRRPSRAQAALVQKLLFLSFLDIEHAK